MNDTIKSEPSVELIKNIHRFIYKETHRKFLSPYEFVHLLLQFDPN